MSAIRADHRPRQIVILHAGQLASATASYSATLPVAHLSRSAPQISPSHQASYHSIARYRHHRPYKIDADRFQIECKAPIDALQARNAAF